MGRKALDPKRDLRFFQYDITRKAALKPLKSSQRKKLIGSDSVATSNGARCKASVYASLSEYGISFRALLKRSRVASGDEFALVLLQEWGLSAWLAMCFFLIGGGSIASAESDWAAAATGTTEPCTLSNGRFAS
jgi:hypothetical protein